MRNTNGHPGCCAQNVPFTLFKPLMAQNAMHAMQFCIAKLCLGVTKFNSKQNCILWKNCMACKKKKKKATPKCFSSCWKIIWCDTFKWTLFQWNLFHFMQLEESCRLFVFQNVHTVQYFTNEYCTILFNFIVSRCQQKSQSYISLNFCKFIQNSLHGWISTTKSKSEICFVIWLN